jgi:hypothetical protein
MQNKLVTGAVAGLVAGLAFGVMMQLMTAPTPDGGRVPMMMMVAMVVRSESLLVGWLYHLFNSAVIGVLFAMFLGSAAEGSAARGIALGVGWGIVWWVLGALVLMPLLLGMPAFAALRIPPMRPVAIGSLVGHLVYGVILGSLYYRLHRVDHTVTAATIRAGQTR